MTHGVAGRAERLKVALEIVLIVGGVVFAIVFLPRQWGYPNATISCSIAERSVRGSIAEDELVATVTFSVGDAANLKITRVDADCHIDGGASCAGGCGGLANMLKRGDLARGDSFTYGCSWRVPADACVDVTVEVTGRALAPSWGASRWKTGARSCSHR